MPPSLGNDIVDLKSPERVCHPRFPSRICSQREFLGIRDRNPEHIWTLWAAKEAAYKTLKRHNQSLHFSPCAFEVSEDFNHVTYSGQRLALRVDRSDSYVHAVCASDTGLLQTKQLLLIVEPSTNDPSTYVRGLLKERIRAIFKQDIKISNDPDRWSQVPKIFAGTHELGPVSISHDGDYVAAAFAYAPASPAY
ncbi:MAG: 4'-phosphopantetheinyl transferase superfamily protein [Oligoflexia bacterium]|nr:4'-phosphopantetheinyl transferase superfamily protein [Oligoflexia bacterium]